MNILVRIPSDRLIMKSHKCVGGGAQAPGAIVLTRRKYVDPKAPNGHYATWFYNAQDGGCHSGFYMDDLKEALDSFDSRSASLDPKGFNPRHIPKFRILGEMVHSLDVWDGWHESVGATEPQNPQVEDLFLHSLNACALGNPKEVLESEEKLKVGEMTVFCTIASQAEYVPLQILIKEWENETYFGYQTNEGSVDHWWKSKDNLSNKFWGQMKRFYVRPVNPELLPRRGY